MSFGYPPYGSPIAMFASNPYVRKKANDFLSDIFGNKPTPMPKTRPRPISLSAPPPPPPPPNPDTSNWGMDFAKNLAVAMATKQAEDNAKAAAAAALKKRQEEADLAAAAEKAKTDTAADIAKMQEPKPEPPKKSQTVVDLKALADDLKREGKDPLDSPQFHERAKWAKESLGTVTNAAEKKELAEYLAKYYEAKADKVAKDAEKSETAKNSLRGTARTLRNEARDLREIAGLPRDLPKKDAAGNPIPPDKSRAVTDLKERADELRRDGKDPLESPAFAERAKWAKDSLATIKDPEEKRELAAYLAKFYQAKADRNRKIADSSDTSKSALYSAARQRDKDAADLRELAGLPRERPTKTA